MDRPAGVATEGVFALEVEPAAPSRSKESDPRSARPRIWHLAVLFALSETVPIALAGLAIGAFSFAGYFGSSTRPFTIRRARHLVDLPEGTLIAMGCVAVVCLLLAIAVGTFSSQTFTKRLRLGRGTFSIREIAVASVGGLALSSTVGTVLRFLPGYDSGGLGRFHKICASLDGFELWLAFGVVAVLAPLGEELFYRGAIQTRLMERFGTTAGLVATSVVFGLAHLDPLHIVLGVAMGFYLGWISIVAKSCRTTIAVHAVNNAFAVAVAVAAGAAHKPASHDPRDFVVSGVVSLLVAASCMRWLRRRTSRRESVLALRQSDFASHVALP